eukprot:3407709-Rhodomonas_salina.1
MTGEMAKLFYKKNHIVHQTCCTYQHEGNGRAEAAIGNLSSRVRALLAHAGMPASYWPHALVYAAELENSFTPTAAGSNDSCYYAYHCTHPDNSK